MKLNGKSRLVLILMFCSQVFAAGGNFGGGNGSMSSPFLIEDAADLFAVNRYLSAAYLLTADIDLAGYSFNQAPIAAGTNGFLGCFNGNGHVVRNLAIQGSYYIGLFGYLYHGTITDLGLENVDIEGVRWVGALAGGSRKGTMIRCYSTGTVIGHALSVGGIVGYSESDWYIDRWGNEYDKGPSLLWNCYSHASVSGVNRVGGLTGDIYRSEIRNCYSTGNVGGIAGQGARVGGLVGVKYSGSLILNSYSTGTVSGNYYVGGFVGEFYGGPEQINCFWNTETSGTNTGCGNTSVPGLIGINNTLMAQQSTFGGWDFANDWQMDTGYYKRPLLRGLLEPEFINITSSAGANGSVSPSGDNWYESGGQLQLTASPNGGYVVDGWYVNATLAQNGGLTYDVGTVLQDMNINVTFKTAVSICNVTISHGPNGNVSPLGTVQIERGDQLTITAYPNYGYQVDQWKLDGSVYQYGSNTFTLYGTQTNTGSIAVDVVFKPVMYTVHISSGVPVGNGDLRIGDHGSTAPDGYQPVQQGSGLTIIAYPEAGYEIYAWQINGVLCNYGQTIYEMQYVPGNMTIGVLFKNSVFTGGSGSVYDPYQVYDVATLNAVSDELAAHYIMTNDIDLSAEPDYTDAVIGINPTAPFLGVFDGNNRKITGLSINSHNDYLGLFGCISAGNGLQGQVRNLTLEGVVVRSESSEIGCLCGLNQSGIIEKCRVIGANVGGDERVAVLCGYNTGTIRYSSAEGSAQGQNRIGLLTGNCYQGTISDCYAIGTLVAEGEDTSGGGISGDSNLSTISNSYASCRIDGTSHKLGSFCGWSQSSSYDSCVTDRQAYSVPIGGTGDGDVGSVANVSRSQMQTMAYWAVSGWDFLGNSTDGTGDIWRMCQDGVDFPRLWWQFAAGDIVCGDGVNLMDFASLGENWLMNKFDAGFYKNADVNNDGTIDFNDLMMLSEHWLY